MLYSLHVFFIYFLDTGEWCIGKLIIAVKTEDSQADVCKVSTAVKINTVQYTCDNKSTLKFLEFLFLSYIILQYSRFLFYLTYKIRYTNMQRQCSVFHLHETSPV